MSGPFAKTTPMTSHSGTVETALSSLKGEKP